MSFDCFEVVAVPFPFTDGSHSKLRPALVLSNKVNFNVPAGHCVMAMITSAKNSAWPLDVAIADLYSAGLPAPSVIRMKLFTLDNHFVVKRIGVLSKKDQQKVKKSVSALLG